MVSSWSLYVSYDWRVSINNSNFMFDIDLPHLTPISTISLSVWASAKGLVTDTRFNLGHISRWSYMETTLKDIPLQIPWKPFFLFASLFFLGFWLFYILSNLPATRFSKSQRENDHWTQIHSPYLCPFQHVKLTPFSYPSFLIILRHDLWQTPIHPKLNL